MEKKFLQYLENYALVFSSCLNKMSVTAWLKQQKSVWSVSGEGPLPGSQMTIYPLSPRHDGERDSSLVSLLRRALNPN